MRVEEIVLEFWHGKINELSLEEQELVAEAKAIQSKAKAHITNYKVGVVILGEDKETYTGVNIESDVLTLTVHSEILVTANAIMNGQIAIDTLTVYVTGEPFFPCLLCRQFLYEHFEDFNVIAAGSNGEAMKTRFANLVPYGFRLPK